MRHLADLLLWAIITDVDLGARADDGAPDGAAIDADIGAADLDIGPRITSPARR